ncbi:protoheme IX farnesyltransferase [Bremerella cremea]|uniref:Protoheme IX farnesyltransferase n=1 Tax=Bremerella cremea TaxID=1031537 RepID=A0A368KK59_9BACT|nr:heme o synthase [Bremerella cremea]RCS41074.1 protoheme IX farnesyltransferase [Bremerella cremea]
MSTGPATLTERRSGMKQQLSDYLELTKPKIALLLLVCVAIAGFYASGGQPDIFRLVNVIIGTALVAASSCVWNQCLEVNADRRMARTSRRPIPSGRLSRYGSAVFGTMLGSVGVAYLLATVGWMPALIGVLTWVLYVCIYTPMKQWTPWNTTVGAIAGALPMLMGWLAVNPTLDIKAISLFAILFFWQFPHFMAIAWLYREDYEKGGMQMWSVVDRSGTKAGLQAVSGAMALLLASVVPGLSYIAMPNITYMLLSLFGGTIMLIASLRFFTSRDERTARQLLFASLFYLPIQLGLLVILPSGV